MLPLPFQVQILLLLAQAIAKYYVEIEKKIVNKLIELDAKQIEPYVALSDV